MNARPCLCGGMPEVRRFADYFRAYCSRCGAHAPKSGTEVGALNEWNEAIDADRARLLAERGGAR